MASRTTRVRDWILEEHRSLRTAYDFEVRGIVPRDQLAVRPAGAANSIAWLVWHLARCEDVAINVVTRDVPQVLDAARALRLGVSDFRIGTGLSQADVDAISASIDIDELDAYWTTVRACTARWLEGSPALDDVPDVGRRLAAIPAVVPAEGEWIRDEWSGKPARYFVRSVVLAHGFAHLGEMRSIRGLLGIAGL